jgi:ankyrin repeat protein
VKPVKMNQRISLGRIVLIFIVGENEVISFDPLMCGSHSFLQTPLHLASHFASAQGDVEVVKLLLTRDDLNLNIQDEVRNGYFSSRPIKRISLLFSFIREEE